MTPTPKPWRHPVNQWLRCGVAGLLLAGCASLKPQLPVEQTNIATPTIAPVFRDSPTKIPGPSLIATVEAQPSPTSLASTAPAVAATPASAAAQLDTIVVYDDALNADWSVEQSDKMRYDLASKAYVHSGARAISITPAGDFGRFFLTVRRDARKTYPRDQILGIGLWLNGGANTIATSDLAVTVVGSNQYSYWVADDTSVKIDTPITADSPLFSETRLYFLHINRAIPPNTWVEVIVWLDDLIHDPYYTNVTGLYIKNDKGFVHPFYVDDVQLLVQRQAQ
jgi:hypothetical protein